MRLKKLFQTLQDRNNPDEIESQGPFKCTKKPWLGEGYYFWDTFIELAHWWGVQGYSGNYIICQASYNYNVDEVFDLAGNTEQLVEFREYANLLKQKYEGKDITVGFIIEHMKSHIRSFSYKAIRANAVDSVKYDRKLTEQRLPFIPSNPAYLDLVPPIQVCLLNKKGIIEDTFKIVYPETYCEGYTI